MDEPWSRRLELVPGGVQLTTYPWPRSTSPSWVLVSPQTVGLCSSDLKEVHRSRDVRSDFGHEMVGLVHSSSTDDFPPGLRVCLDPHIPVTRTTAFGETALLTGPPDQLRAALPTVPDGTPDDRAVFTEPLACAVHCAGNVLAGSDVAIIGAGTAGVLLAVLLRLKGCQVTLVNRSPERLTALSRTALLREVPKVLSREVGTRTFGTVVVTTASLDGATFDGAWDLLPQDGGRLVLFGGIRPDWRVPGTQVLLDGIRRGEQMRELERGGRRALLVGTHGATGVDFAAAGAVLAAPLPWTTSHVEELIVDRVTLPVLAALLNDAVRTGVDPIGKHVVDIRR
ncbi:medium chain dehydrogenase/reductase family protein [Kitasatospora sp. GP82]|uniref:medium chain dehydrogenase/reductase family protein n=1 Tax=Kitasatospora sp. GP82 TaxID=3035089 RepID=UPI0024751623|nr:medium chain dehydrogenase/reductase family protein [Kitasatospora sp. GP82]MDH6130297.1 threonine dehydrogenase-like Zn-dependent dehydrogenase [Kitasatospora sp. GP82]